MLSTPDQSGFLTTTPESALTLAQGASPFSAPFVIAYRGIGGMSANCSRYGATRLRAVPRRVTPRQSDLQWIGALLHHTFSALFRAYKRMTEPKCGVALGACGFWDSFDKTFTILAGDDQIIPIDTYIPGGFSPREAVVDSLMHVQHGIQNTRQQIAHSQSGRQLTPELPTLLGQTIDLRHTKPV